MKIEQNQEEEEEEEPPSGTLLRTLHDITPPSTLAWYTGVDGRNRCVCECVCLFVIVYGGSERLP